MQRAEQGAQDKSLCSSSFTADFFYFVFISDVVLFAAAMILRNSAALLLWWLVHVPPTALSILDKRIYF